MLWTSKNIATGGTSKGAVQGCETRIELGLCMFGCHLRLCVRCCLQCVRAAVHGLESRFTHEGAFWSCVSMCVRSCMWAGEHVHGCIGRLCVFECV